MFGGRDKPIRIIGNTDNQRPDKWNSIVQLLLRLLAHRGRCMACLQLLLRLNDTHYYCKSSVIWWGEEVTLLL